MKRKVVLGQVKSSLLAIYNSFSDNSAHMKMTTKQKQVLKAKAHSLKPIVFIGQNGFTETVHEEMNRALQDHELIKIRIHESDREIRKDVFESLCKALACEAVQLIGKIGIIYRKSMETR